MPLLYMCSIHKPSSTSGTVCTGVEIYCLVNVSIHKYQRAHETPSNSTAQFAGFKRTLAHPEIWKLGAKIHSEPLALVVIHVPGVSARMHSHTHARTHARTHMETHHIRTVTRFTYMKMAVGWLWVGTCGLALLLRSAGTRADEGTAEHARTALATGTICHPVPPRAHSYIHLPSNSIL